MRLGLWIFVVAQFSSASLRSAMPLSCSRRTKAVFMCTVTVVEVCSWNLRLFVRRATETERVKGTLGAVTVIAVAVAVGVGAATVCGTSMGATSSPTLLLVGAATATARLSPPLLRESLWRGGWPGLSGLVWVDGRGERGRWSNLRF
jgi:hypothetical protein